MTKKKKISSLNLAKKLQRKLAMQEGYYDGRFRNKVIKDKKKEANRKASRNKLSPDDFE